MNGESKLELKGVTVWNPEIGLVANVNEFQDTIITRVFDEWAVTYTYLAFAFVFFYFGLQKPAPVYTPVRTPVAVYVYEISNILSFVFRTTIQIPTEMAILFIGTYEMFLGLLFLFRQIRLAFWFFFAHQIVGFLSLVLIWDSVFQPPWITIAGVDLPWALGGFSAFVLKNVIFVGAFMLLASKELGTGAGSPDNP